MSSSFDVSSGIEKIPIPCRTPRPGQDHPRDFVYIRRLEHPDGPRLEGVPVCNCSSQCQMGSDPCVASKGICGKSCPCRRTKWQDPDLDVQFTREQMLGFPLYECGPACGCDPLQCQNRTSQNGLQCAVYIENTPKGWSAYAGEDIRAGQCVCQYAGELVSSAEAKIRLQKYDVREHTVGHALLVIREVLPSLQTVLRINVDATQKGNVARFMNHDCGGGNLVPVVVRMTGKLVPHVAMVSKRDICQGEELTFMYGAPNPGPEAMKNLNSKSPSDNACKPRRCLCQSPECLGYLPSDALD